MLGKRSCRLLLMKITDRITKLVLARRPGIGPRSVKRDIANTCDITYEAVRQWFAGDTENIKNENLVALAKGYDTTIDWLLSGNGDPPRRKGDPHNDTSGERSSTPGARTALALVQEMLAKSGKSLAPEARDRLLAAAEEPQPPSPATNVIQADFSRSTVVKGDTISIAQYDVRAAMGDGQLPADYREFVRNLVVDKVEFEDLGLKYTSLTNLKVITGWGQSMLGTIEDKAPIIVDIGVNEFVEDGVYVFTWLGHLYIKRVQVLDAEHFKLLSDNKVYDSQTARMDDMYFHARVLGAWNFKRL